ncbi:hypothetical protein N7495_001268 [Penicillium taxi]|uniref:uncharacterized protein n=1 Tax=Penicillium taxi TaxID=168475 RepID=UPI002545882B|nr:uncharacterized protein N7495_001268 [Penicillium taxi]KAJ5908586.1 hypothetical protein N7495_001268 [Penicillium taxi]
MDTNAHGSRRDSRQPLSSLTRQGWPRLPPSYAPSVGDSGRSHGTSRRRHESTAGRLDTVHRLVSLYQISGNPPPESPEDQPTDLGSGSGSGSGPVLTQPVLVTAYTRPAQVANRKLSAMSPRRLFFLNGSKTSAPNPPDLPLPTDKDFSIESILQAIEPDIRETLDTIAEICGRSKLSLANEYGSHIAPLGEIRAPAGGLVPVEEVSPSDERQADEGVLLFDNNPDLTDADQNLHPFSFYRYLENLRQAASALERRNEPGSTLPETQSNAPAALINQLVPELETTPSSATVTRECISKSKNSSRSLLAKRVAANPSQKVVTPAVVSEMHLEAQDDDVRLETESWSFPTNPTLSPDFPANARRNILEAVRFLLSWLRCARADGPGSIQSAESRLRAMLDRPTASSTASPAT